MPYTKLTNLTWPIKLSTTVLASAFTVTWERNDLTPSKHLSMEQGWVQCTACSKWRRIATRSLDALPDRWTCALNPDPLRRSCNEPEEEYSDDEHAPTTDSTQRGSGVVFAVERLLDSRYSGNRARTQYLVRWLGFSARHDSWEDAANILDASLVTAFEAEVAAHSAASSSAHADAPRPARAASATEAPPPPPGAPAARASSFLAGTERRGADGRMWRAVARGSRLMVWVPAAAPHEAAAASTAAPASAGSEPGVPMAADPELPGWRVRQVSTMTGRGYCVFTSPRGENFRSRAAALRAEAEERRPVARSYNTVETRPPRTKLRPVDRTWLDCRSLRVNVGTPLAARALRSIVRRSAVGMVSARPRPSSR